MKWLAEFLTFINSQRWLHGECAWQPPEFLDELSGESLEQQRFSVAYSDFLKREDMLEQAFLYHSWHPEVPQCEDLESEDAIRSLEVHQLHDSFDRATGLLFLCTPSESSDAESDADFFGESELEREWVPPIETMFGVRWMNRRGPDVGNGFISKRLALRRRAFQHWLRY
jgi:hypothetical protein